MRWSIASVVVELVALAEALVLARVLVLVDPSSCVVDTESRLDGGGDTAGVSDNTAVALVISSVVLV